MTHVGRRRTALLGLTCVAVTLAAACGRAAEPRAEQLFPHDRALDRLVTLAEAKPLQTVLARLIPAGGRRVLAARHAEWEPVIVHLRDRPAREVMAGLAELLDYTWGREPASQDLPR